MLTVIALAATPDWIRPAEKIVEQRVCMPSVSHGGWFRNTPVTDRQLFLSEANETYCLNRNTLYWQRLPARESGATSATTGAYNNKPALFSAGLLLCRRKNDREFKDDETAPAFLSSSRG
jgi:hypothetical protein